MNLASHGHSDVGFVRESNEDAFLVDDERGLYAVADGVGGLPHGSLASRLAMQFFRAMIQNHEQCSTEDELRQVVHAVHKNIVESGVLVGGENGIGTTFSAARLIGDKMMIAHVGDSSIYLKNGQGMKKISRSHTLGDELIEKHGPDAMNDMPEHYMHTLTRCMGQDIDFAVDVETFTIKPGDSILICSDGVTNMIEEEIIESLMEENEPQDFVPALIDMANQNGGVDNSTVVAFVLN
tara:strand:- start:589 stop:1302 length:714 start_codon:yes stop_codon:yes gene_type:complete